MKKFEIVQGKVRMNFDDEFNLYGSNDTDCALPINDNYIRTNNRDDLERQLTLDWIIEQIEAGATMFVVDDSGEREGVFNEWDIEDGEPITDIRDWLINSILGYINKYY